MALGSENGLSASDVALLSGNNRGGGAWNGEWLIALIVLFMFPMMFGRNGMWGNGNNCCGSGNGNGSAYIPYAISANCALTRADLCEEFNNNSLQNAVRGIQQGLCDGFYAMQGSINNLGMNVMQGFNGVNQGICNLGYNVQQGINGLNTSMMQGFSAANVVALQNQNAIQTQLADCCCTTQRAIERTNYDAAMRGAQTDRLIDRGFCDTNYNAATNTTAIIQNAHNDTDRVLARLDAMESSRKDERIAEQAAQIQALQLAASQAQQNNAIGAMISASEATILRRTGAECPTPAYVVQPPTPVNFPTNCCGTVNFGGCGNGCGNGCGC